MTFRGPVLKLWNYPTLVCALHIHQNEHSSKSPIAFCCPQNWCHWHLSSLFSVHTPSPTSPNYTYHCPTSSCLSGHLLLSCLSHLAKRLSLPSQCMEVLLLTYYFISVSQFCPFTFRALITSDSQPFVWLFVKVWVTSALQPPKEQVPCLLFISTSVFITVPCTWQVVLNK